LLFGLFGCYLCCSVYCLCVNVYCHRVTNQLQLINILLLLLYKCLIDGVAGDVARAAYRKNKLLVASLLSVNCGQVPCGTKLGLLSYLKLAF
jgi:hypothetical protein